MLIEPYTYVRAITIGLGLLWTLGGALRMLRFARRWRDRLRPLGLSDAWLRRQVATAALRATVLDPVNLALLLLLFGLWSVGARR